MSDSKKKGKIYGLVCPMAGHIRYVGQTIGKLQYRLRKHIRRAKRARERGTEAYWVGNWILSVLNEDESNIEIRLIEDVPVQKLDERERYWIAHYRELYPEKMTNISDGGTNAVLTGENHPFWGTERPDSVKQKISEKNSGERNGMYGTSHWEIWKDQYGPLMADLKKAEVRKRTTEAMVNSEKFQKSRKSKEFREKISKACGMPIYLLDKDRNIVAEFHSCTKAAEWLDCTRGNVKNARRDQRMIQRKYWVVRQEDYDE